MADKKPIRVEVSKKTGNKRPVYLDDQGKEYYGEVIPASGDVVVEKAAGMTYQEAQGPKGLENLNKLRKNVGLGPSTDVKTGIAELQEYSGKNYDELVVDYMIKRSPKPNKRLEEKLRKLKDPNTGRPYPATKEGAVKAYEDKVLSKDDVVDAYKDKLWHFRAIAPKQVPVSREEYEKLMKRPGAIKQGDKVYFQEDPANYHEYTEYIPEDFEKETEKEEEDQDVTLPPEKEGTKAGPIAENPIIPQLRGREKAPWWLQDIIQTAGAAGDLARIKRYPPWQATPQVRLPDATFYDPTRELAANAEQANMAYQAQTAFTNPQQLAAASAVTQGQAAKNAADVMGRYNNLNVGLANQLSKERTDIMNAASQNKANLDTQLWDKYTIMNQQFDNSKAQARQNLRNSYISAITNRANTANMNSLYPQYAVDPSTGGFSYFKGDPTKIKATNSDSFKARFKEALDATGGDTKDALKYLQLQSSGSLPEDGTDNPYQGYSGTV